MMRKYIIILTISLIIGNVHAQSEQDRINEIKSDIGFLYATGTSMNNADEAAKNAQDLLAVEIEQWLKVNVSGDIAGYIAKSQGNYSTIQTRRGKLYRAFAFVSKMDILPYYQKEDLMHVEFTNSKEQQTENSIIEEILYYPTSEEQQMMNVKTFTELNEYINRGREDKSIIDVGNYANLPQNGVIYVFIHNRLGEVPACIKVTDGYAINIATGKEDDISKYKGCGAIWIKQNNK